MKEHIYTIPINEQFEKTDGCPFCGLLNKLEYNEIERITGASMMEPSVRIETNKLGFCERHFGMMLQVGKRLPIALMLQSHLESVKSDIFKKKSIDRANGLKKLSCSCYVCNRVEYNMNNIYSNFFEIYRKEPELREKFAKQTMFCFDHYVALLENGQKYLNKKEFAVFAEIIDKIEDKYLETLQTDIDWFCKKFDYRFSNEPWKNSKDAIERTVYTLTGHMPEFKSGVNTSNL